MLISLRARFTVRKEQLKFKSEEFIQLYVVTINTLYNLKIYIIGCDDNSNISDVIRFSTAYNLIFHST
jgi:hypothetical protein